MFPGTEKIWAKKVAMLCVALLASFLLQEPAATEHAVRGPAHGEITVGDGVVIHVHADDSHHDHGLPDHEGKSPHAHQCLCATFASLPSALGVGMLHQGAMPVRFTLPQQAAGVDRFYALERPPKLISHA